MSDPFPPFIADSMDFVIGSKRPLFARSSVFFEEFCPVCLARWSVGQHGTLRWLEIQKLIWSAGSTVIT
jgi:hypothetical protein